MDTQDTPFLRDIVFMKPIQHYYMGKLIQPQKGNGILLINLYGSNSSILFYISHRKYLARLHRPPFIALRNIHYVYQDKHTCNIKVQ